MPMGKRNQPKDYTIFGLLWDLSVFLVENSIQNISEAVTTDEETVLKEW